MLIGDATRMPVHIVGVAGTLIGKVQDHTELFMVALAPRESLGEAGMTLWDVDGIFVNHMSARQGDRCRCPRAVR